MRFFLLFFALMINGTSGSAQSTFRNDYGDTFDRANFNSIVSDSSGYLIAGRKWTPPSVVGIVIKTDLEGNILWERIFGDTTSRLSILSSIKMSNGTFLLNAFDQILQKSHLYIMDASGNIIYQKQISNGYILNLFEVNPNEVVIATILSSGFSIIAMDSSLNTIWGRSYGVNDTASSSQISQTNDNGFLILYNHPPTDNDFILKLDSAGNILWSKKLSSFYSRCRMSETTNGDIFLVSIWDSLTSIYGIRIDKLDYAGNLLWSEKLSGVNNYEVSRSVIATSDGGCLILGYAKDVPMLFATLMVKINPSGNIVWSETLGNFYDMSDPIKIINTTDNAYALLCNTLSSGSILFKMDSVGFTGCQGTPFPMTVQPFVTPITDDTLSIDTTSIQFVNIFVPSDTISMIMNQTCYVNKVEEVNSHSLIVFPSLFKDKLTVQNTKVEGQIKVYNLTGKIFIDRETSSGETELNTSFLGSGFYVIRYEEQGIMYFAKAIKY